MTGYTPEDEVVISEYYQRLMQSCEAICKNEDDRKLINKAFALAKDAHKGVRRKSGEPYILHPIEVAQIVVDEIGLGAKSVAASLLHDVVEDTDYTVEDMEAAFGTRIATMVDGLTKMSGVFDKDTSKQAEYFRKVLLTLSDDVRVILIKIADRLHNMRTLGSMPAHKQIKITSETIYLFAPLAFRLGLYSIKTELEDLALKYRFPEQYEEIKLQLEKTEADRSKFIEKFNTPIIQQLKDSGIDFTVSGRVKSIYSIWSKMQRKQIGFEEIYDLFAIRIVFKPSPMIPEKSQCWHIYSLVTDIYKPKPDRIRDWVNIPKANGYEALHATVMGPDGVWAEVQIRSERMEEIAEKGFAAHWKYKKLTVSENEDEFDKWLKKIREALNNPTENAVDFLDNFKMTLYTTEIVVFTPKGDSRKLPQGATALDFAYEIHSNVGNKAIGVKINHKIESIFTGIRSGDQVEIITSDNVEPTAQWLEHVTTAKAKQSIKNYLKRNNEDNVLNGKQIFEIKLREFGLAPSSRIFRKILPAYECSTKDEFYSHLGAGIIDLENIEKILKENTNKKILKFWSLQVAKPFKFLSNNNPNPDSMKQKEMVMDDSDQEDKQFTIAKCCNPIPGDQVMGYKDIYTGEIVVHKTSCDELTRYASQHGDRIISIKWSSRKAMSYLSILELRGIDRVGILMDIASVITGELNINIRELSIQSHDGIFEGRISLYVKNIHDLNLIIKKVSEIKGVDKVKRILRHKEEKDE